MKHRDCVYNNGQFSKKDDLETSVSFRKQLSNFVDPKSLAGNSSQRSSDFRNGPVKHTLTYIMYMQPMLAPCGG